jgi:hypothetical protein
MINQNNETVITMIETWQLQVGLVGIVVILSIYLYELFRLQDRIGFLEKLHQLSSRNKKIVKNSQHSKSGN